MEYRRPVGLITYGRLRQPDIRLETVNSTFVWNEFANASPDDRFDKMRKELTQSRSRHSISSEEEAEENYVRQKTKSNRGGVSKKTKQHVCKQRKKPVQDKGSGQKSLCDLYPNFDDVEDYELKVVDPCWPESKPPEKLSVTELASCKRMLDKFQRRHPYPEDKAAKAVSALQDAVAANLPDSGANNAQRNQRELTNSCTSEDGRDVRTNQQLPEHAQDRDSRRQELQKSNNDPNSLSLFDAWVHSENNDPLESSDSQNASHSLTDIHKAANKNLNTVSRPFEENQVAKQKGPDTNLIGVPSSSQMVTPTSQVDLQKQKKALKRLENYRQTSTPNSECERAMNLRPFLGPCVEESPCASQISSNVRTFEELILRSSSTSSAAAKAVPNPPGKENSNKMNVKSGNGPQAEGPCSSTLITPGLRHLESRPNTYGRNISSISPIFLSPRPKALSSTDCRTDCNVYQSESDEEVLNEEDEINCQMTPVLKPTPSIGKKCGPSTRNIESQASHFNEKTFSENRARKFILSVCTQSHSLTFCDVLPRSVFHNCIKIGEGSYGDVFKVKSGKDAFIIKIVPFETAPQNQDEGRHTFRDMLSEVIILKDLTELKINSACVPFIEIYNISYVQGLYPRALIKQWNIHKKKFGSENRNPGSFKENQQYLLFEMEDGGIDLEHFEFKTAEEGKAIFLQLSCALAVGEINLEFEHRDLHWGNILISRTADMEMKFKVFNQEISFQTHGVIAKIIDFSLSRIYKRGDIFYTHMRDESLFAGQGDYQFDIYRLMRQQNCDNWKLYNPKTNIFWLHYILQKLCDFKVYSNKGANHLEALNHMKELGTLLLKFESAMGFVSAYFDIERV